MAAASGACSRANRRRTASGRDISAPLSRALNCSKGTVNQSTQNAASAAEMSWGEVGQQAWQILPSSAGHFAKDRPALHSPVDTATGNQECR
jgi:hypothetical protein